MADWFADKWILVTGASSGLGESFARQLAARRANLILTARSKDKLESLAAELSSAHGIATEVIAQDLGAPGGAAALCDEVARRGRPLRFLVSNAGFGENGQVAGSNPARMAEMVRLNCEALTYLTTWFLPSLLAAREGGILHVGSIAGAQPVPYMATYGATKAFVESFSLAIAEEVRGSGVRVMVLCPGPVPTGFQKVAGSDIAPSQRSAVLSAEETVAQALAAWERGELSFIPGLFNRVQTAASQLVPRSLNVRIVGKMMLKKRRLD